MALVEMIMPKMGESVMEGTVLNWLKNVGDTIEQDEPVLEVATDKVDTEVPATHAGILKEILVQENEVAQVGQAIALIATDSEEAPETSTPSTAASEEEPALEAIEENISQTSNSASIETSSSTGSNNGFYSPLVKNIAKQEGISLEELATVQGTGLENRITKHDILAYIEQHQTQTTQQQTASPTQPKPSKQKVSTKPQTQQVSPAQSLSGNVEIIEMDRMRKMIAQRMVESVQTSPHVTTFIEVDVTNIVLWRNKVKKDFEAKNGEKITFTPIFIEAIAKTLKDFPMVNISVDSDKIIRKKDINIGMATALPNNNLIVPIIPNADQLNLVGLSKKVNDLARRARQNKLKPDELSGGTYSVSNIGSFGNEMGTPIINQPQTAIMAIGAIKKKPAVLETPTGDVIAIRHMMFISHSYDHRVIDGALGGKFARQFADYLEQFDVNREIF